MSAVNSQLLIGNLGKSADIRSIDGSRSKATFSLATNKTYKNREGQNITNTYWHNIVVWDPRLVDIAEQHCTTGRQVLVEGESTTRSYQDRNGNTNYIREVKANNIILIDQIEQQGSPFRNLSKSFIVGRLLEKPVLTTNERGESSCHLVFGIKEGTLSVELTGPKADIATRYLDEGRLAHVNYEIVSTSPFKAVGTDLTLLGQRPASQDNSASPERKETHTNASGNMVNAQPDNNSDLDDLPF